MISTERLGDAKYSPSSDYRTAKSLRSRSFVIFLHFIRYSGWQCSTSF